MSRIRRNYGRMAGFDRFSRNLLADTTLTHAPVGEGSAGPAG
jgi:hypothetical protein